MMTYSEVRRKPRVQTVNDEESMTMQSDRDSADIRTILRRYDQTGVLLRRDVHLEFRDVSQFEDYADMARQTKEAEAVFMSLAPEVRRVFNNDVYQWLDAAHDQDKFEALRPQLEKVGAIEPMEVPEPVVRDNPPPDSE